MISHLYEFLINWLYPQEEKSNDTKFAENIKYLPRDILNIILDHYWRSLYYSIIIVFNGMRIYRQFVIDLENKKSYIVLKYGKGHNFTHHFELEYEPNNIHYFTDFDTVLLLSH